jgi:hypothetical protein
MPRPLPLRLGPCTAAFGAIVILAMFAAGSLAQEVARVIPRRATVDRPLDEAYGTLKHYFNDSSLSRFTLISADDATHTLVAKQSGIGPNDWNELAFCQTSGEQMVYTFTNGTVIVTAKMTAAGKHKTFVSVSADFHGLYTLSLASKSTDLACVSKGVLENNLIAVAGGTAPAPTP